MPKTLAVQAGGQDMDTNRIQQEELEAMRAIFGDDWRDISPSKTAWGAVESGWWIVRLKVHDGKVAVSLKGRLLKNYPLNPPSLSLVEPMLLGPDHVHRMNKQINDHARKSLGREMLFDIITLITDFMEENHLALPHTSPKGPNLMEEKARRDAEEQQSQIQRQKQESARLASIAEQEKDRLAAQIRQEHERRASLIRDAHEAERLQRQREEEGGADVLRKGRTTSGRLDYKDGQRVVTFSDGLDSFDPVILPGFPGTWPSWRAFGPPIKQDPLWVTYDVEGSRPHNEESLLGVGQGYGTASQANRPISIDPPVCSLVVIDFAQAYYTTPPGQRKIETLLREIRQVAAIRQQHIVPVFASKKERVTPNAERIYILTQRHTSGGSLLAWLRASETLGEGVAVDCLRQILSGLSTLHEAEICHKQLHLESITVSLFNAERPLLSISGASYVKTLRDMNRSNPFVSSTSEDIIPQMWLPPEEIDAPYAYSPERDIWYAGLVFVQLLYGPNVLLEHPSLGSIIDNADYAPHGVILEVLNSIFDPRPRKRTSASAASQKLLHSIGDDLGAIAIRPSSLASPMSNSFFRSPVNSKGLSHYYDTSTAQVNATSRYRNDFEEVEWLGEGGFGQVVKARHRIEKQFYAIKKIKLQPEDDEQKVFREAESLSRVNHRYIVRYIQCWLETSAKLASEHGEDQTDISATDSQLTPSKMENEGDEDDIFGPPDFDDVSSTTISHSKSFPRIRFANSSDEEEDSDEGDDETEDDFVIGRQAFGTRHKSKSPKMRHRSLYQQRTLYIQMEYVEKQTLKEAITQGLSTSECWRLFRQILEALAYLAGLHIVHRDLKPSNILLDLEGNVKLCDFGLSTTDNNLAPMLDGIHLSASLNDMTSGVGTHLYVSPDVIQKRTYGTKADVYSLGIIFFEMCYPMKSGMERVQVLSNLRLPRVRFPPDWNVAERSAQTQIVEWLLKHDPEERPEADDLIRSSLLPEGREEGYYAEAIRKVAHASSSHYPALIAKLFNPERLSTESGSHVMDYTYDPVDAYLDESQAWTRVVKDRLATLFDRHGAIELVTPLLAPASTTMNVDQHSVVRLLDSQGNLIQLPSDGMVSFARYVGIKGIERIKRYQFGWRYSESAAGGQPRAVGEINYDLISPSRTLVSEAEAIEITDKLVQEFQALTTLQYEIHIAHEAILSTILDSAITTEAKGLANRIISDFATGVSATSINQKLASPLLSRQQSDILKQCLVVDELPVVRDRILSLFPAATRPLEIAFAEISETISYVRALGVTRPILVRPAMSRRAAAHKGGIMFECVRREKRKDLIALGGRYDDLLHRFGLPIARRDSARSHGVGVSILVDRIAYHVGKFESGVSKKMMTKERENERSFGFWSPSRCDVYIASFGPDQLRLRLDVCGELWRAGISADLQYDDDRTLDDVLLDCQAQNVLYILIPRPNRPFIKIRSVLRRSEDEVSRGETCTWLRAAIAEQRRIDLNTAYSEAVVVEKPHSTVITSDNSPEGDIRILLRADDEKRTKRNTKSMFTEKIKDFMTDANTRLPVFGIDLPGRTLAQLCLQPSDWLSDDEAWKHAQIVLATDRSYATTIRSALAAELSTRSTGFVFLYALRESKAFLLTITK